MDIPDGWCQAIAQAGDIPPAAADMSRRLVELTEQIIRLLVTEPFEHSKAQEIGAALAHLHCAHPDALGQTQEVLVRRFMQGLPAEQAVALCPHLAALIGALATGFFRQARELILAEQKQAHNALNSGVHRLEQTVQALLRASADPTLLLNPDGTIVALNEAAARRLGKSASELTGVCIFELFPPDVAERRKSQSAQAVRSRQLVHFEDERGGRWFDHMVCPILSEQGEVVRLAVIARDVTEHRQIQQRLLLSERMAAIGRFAAALAHEINNPLQAIRSNLDLVLGFDLPPDERQRYLYVISQEITDLGQITQHVLSLAHPAEDTRYPVKIAELVKRTLILTGKQLEQAHVQVTTDFPADLPSVLAAPNEIGRVLLNLLINAVEVMPDGGHVHLTARADGDMVALAISNDGPPIPSEHINRIFDAFFTTKSAGAGLGLTVSYRIIEQHGGTIRVENLEGERGVAFTITLPIARNAKRQEAIT